MRDLRQLDRYRVRVEAYDSAGDETCGCFVVPSPIDKRRLHVIASSGEGWDHVSISRKDRPPRWSEMEHIKRMFFEDGETAMQLHVPVSDHINVHPNCLHLWRPQAVDISRPPDWMLA